MTRFERGVPELGLAAPVPSISSFVEDELERLEAFALQRNSHAAILVDLDAVFHTTLREAWV